MIVSYASYVRLRYRVYNAMRSVGLLVAIALISLMAFAWASNPDKGATDRPSTVYQRFQRVGDDDRRKSSPPTLPPVMFENGRADIPDNMLTEIAAARELLRSDPMIGLVLLAHTDTLGRQSFNIDLARRRGNAVRRMLIEQGGISASRLFVAELPEADLPRITRQEVGWAANRSVEFMVVSLPRQAINDVNDNKEAKTKSD
jgi:outer membrane protein OmpA-like peptidoglycan-associated protein